MNVPLIGIIENMSGLSCPHCGQIIEVFKKGGGEKAADEMGAPFLGAVPLDAEIGSLGDRGVTFTGLGDSGWKGL
jgi:ATP-binding protein involved in chromosome partitioning